MALAAGTRVGAYEITGELGAGGMGEVYRAADTNLKREVAIKILPPAFASDADRIARFRREAEALAALNHPNIAQIYGLERSGEVTALVMELIEGPTLADRIAEGPILADEALDIAMQIADALEAAHERNIVHRDLKPANVKLKSDGTVKVLDFGIATAPESPVATSGRRSPTLLTPALTEAGVLLGTAAYMAPEQARGRAVDRRADIWAFGCVLYEMLSGQPAFGGQDVTTTLARVLEREPNLTALPATLPSAVRRTIELCLEKDLKKRLADIRDVRLGLDGAFEKGLRRTADDAMTQPLWRRALLLVAPALATGVVAIGIAWTLWPAAQPRPVVRFDYALSEGLSLAAGSAASQIALSPDGRRFVYTARDGLYLRSMDDLQARRISGTQGIEFNPFFSPDGESIAYFAQPGGLKRIAVVGGASVPITTVVSTVTSDHSGSWAANGTILFGQPAGVFRVSATGGKPELVIPAQKEERIYGPQLLPNGDSVLFTLMTTQNRDEAQIVVQSLSTGKRTVLINGGYDARYLPTGYLSYVLGDSLFAVAFDAGRLAVSDNAVPLVQGLASEVFGYPLAFYTVSNNGTLIFAPRRAAQSDLIWVDRAGREESLGLKPCWCANPRLSPDGTRVALTVSQDNGKNLDLWVWSLAQRNLMRLTFEGGLEDAPLWTPDSERIAYRVSPDGIFLRPADGTGARERLLQGSAFGGGPVPLAWTLDGKLVFADGASRTMSAIAVEGGGKRSVPVADFSALRAVLSPDGHWLAYQSEESGEFEVYVRPYPEVDAGKWQISSGGGEEPKWARDGHTLFFLGPKSLMASRVESASNFEFQTPEPVLDRGKYVLSSPAPIRYDISPDGRRFLVLKPVTEGNVDSDSARVVVVENWFEELRRLVPKK